MLVFGGRTRSAVAWKMIPLCLIWCIWRERNARCFEDSARSLEEIVHFFLSHSLHLDGRVARSSCC
jgi:hypothetical protein